MLGSDGLPLAGRGRPDAADFQGIQHEGLFDVFRKLSGSTRLRSAHAAIPHAALVERADAFAAELLCVISGLAEIRPVPVPAWITARARRAWVKLIPW